MTDLIKKISNGELLVADGAMGTELIRLGLATGDCPEIYNISHSDLIRTVYSTYFEAGSDIVETNTFGANQARLTHHNLEDKVQLINRSAAELARSVCPQGKFVAGSIGPTGEMLEPLGTFSLGKTYDFFRVQALALAEGGVDVIFVETMMSIEEAEIAVRAAVTETGLPVSASMTFNRTSAGLFTAFGVDLATMSQRLEAAGANIVGINCGEGVQIVVEGIKQLRKVTNLPLIAQPNAGTPTVKAEKLIYSETPAKMIQALSQILEPPLAIVGGCCGTGPDYIHLLRAIVDSR